MQWFYYACAAVRKALAHLPAIPPAHGGRNDLSSCPCARLIHQPNSKSSLATTTDARPNGYPAFAEFRDRLFRDAVKNVRRIVFNVRRMSAVVVLHQSSAKYLNT